MAHITCRAGVLKWTPIAVACLLAMLVADGAHAQTSQGFVDLAARAEAVSGEPARLTAPFFQVCEDLGDDARLAGCQRSLAALRAQRRPLTYRMRLRGRNSTGANYLVRVGAYNPITRRVPIEVGPLVFGAVFHSPGRSSGALSTVPSVRGAFPDTPILRGGYPVRDDQAGLDFTNHHHLGASFGVDVIFRLGAQWEDRVGTGASVEVHEGMTLEVLAIRVVELNDGVEVSGNGDRLHDAAFNATVDDPVILERVGAGGGVAASPAAPAAQATDAELPTDASTSTAGGEPAWRAPLSGSAIQNLGGSRAVVLARLTRDGGTCREITGGFRGQPAVACRGLGTATGLERESPEVTLVFEGESLRGFMVVLGQDDSQTEAVESFRRDAAFWSERFGQQPPPGQHDRPEIIRYEVGGATVRVALTATQGSGFLRMLLVEDRDFAQRQDAISRGFVPNVTCGLRGTLDERALDCARPVSQGGAGPASVRSFETTERGRPRRFVRYRLIRQTPDGTRVWLTGHGGALAAVMRPARREEALRHCAEMPQWAGLGAVPPGTMRALQQGQDSARELAELFPDVISSMRSEWFWAGTQWGREVSIQLGDGYGTGRRTPFIRVNQGPPSGEPLRYFCGAQTTTDTRSPAGRAIFAESEVDSDAPCGLSGSVDERLSDCAQRLGAAANYTPREAPAGAAPWRVVSQTVQGERVWREPGSSRVWFYVPESTHLSDASAVCAAPTRAQGRRAYLQLPARLPTGAEFRDAAVLGLNRVLVTDPPQYWSASTRSGRILVLGWEGAVRWYDPHEHGLPPELPFFCVADAP